MHRLPWKFEEGGGTNRRRDIKNGNDDRNDEGDNKALPLSQMPPPTTRRPGRHCVTEKFKDDAAVHLVDSGSSRLNIYQDVDDDYGRAEDQNNVASEEDGGDDDKNDGMTDMYKCMQLMGGASEQLYRYGVCVLWLIQESRPHPEDDILDLLDCMEHALDAQGMKGLLMTLARGDDEASGAASVDDLLDSHHVLGLWAMVAR